MGGSNSWVVSGKLTDTGYQILANDPHLENLTQWHLVNLVMKDNFINGVSMPSTPTIPVGKSKKFSWESTILYFDNVDLYEEKLIDGKLYYLFKDEWLSCTEFQEEIDNLRVKQIICQRSSFIQFYAFIKDEFIKGGSSLLNDLYEEKLQLIDGKYQYLYKDEWFPCEEFQEQIDNLGVKIFSFFQKTQHGPILENYYDQKNKQIIRFPGSFSIKGTYLEEDSCFFLALSKFQLGEDFQKGLEGLKCVISQNFSMVLSSEKDIGFVPGGKQIIRTGNPDSWGIPKKRWTGEVEWVRYLTPEEHPIVINPEKGYIISSNQRLIYEHYWQMGLQKNIHQNQLKQLYLPYLNNIIQKRFNLCHKDGKKDMVLINFSSRIQQNLVIMSHALKKHQHHAYII